MNPFPDELHLKYRGNRRFEVTKNFRYITNAGKTITVPAGEVTDFASIPRPFWNILPPHGKYSEAAVVHDFLYKSRGLDGEYTRQECDAVFYEAMSVLGVGKFTRWIMYRAVRRFGGFHFPK